MADTKTTMEISVEEYNRLKGIKDFKPMGLKEQQNYHYWRQRNLVHNPATGEVAKANATEGQKAFSAGYNKAVSNGRFAYFAKQYAETGVPFYKNKYGDFCSKQYYDSILALDANDIKRSKFITKEWTEVKMKDKSEVNSNIKSRNTGN